MRGTTLGIVGFGRVGREVARRAAPFGAASSPPTARRARPTPGSSASTRWPNSTGCCRNATPSRCAPRSVPRPTGLIDARRLALMKPDAFLINIARGPVIDEDALYAALRDGRIGGAAIDVWWQYPTAAEPNRRGSRHPFHELPNVIVTPHNSGWTDGMVRAPLGRGRRKPPPLRARRDSLINLVTTNLEDAVARMKTLFLGGLAARVAPRILGKMRERLDDPASSPTSTTCSG